MFSNQSVSVHESAAPRPIGVVPLALMSSSTFWNDACSLPPQSDMTVIVLPAAAVPTGVGVPDPAHAVITIDAMNAIAANDRVDRITAYLPCGLVQYRSPSRAAGTRSATDTRDRAATASGDRAPTSEGLRRAAGAATPPAARRADPHGAIAAHQRHESRSRLRRPAVALPVLGRGCRRAAAGDRARDPPRRARTDEGGAHPRDPPRAARARHRAR